MAQRQFVSFAEVKEKISIPDVLRVLGIADRFRESNGALVGCCPLPQHRHGPRPNETQFRIDQKRGLWLYRCFGDCAATPFGGGDVIRLVQGMTGLSDAHVRFWFADHFGDRLDAKKPKPDADPATPEEVAREVGLVPQRAEAKQDESIVFDAKRPLKPLRFRLNLDPQAAYLRQRGLTDETVQRFGLGLCSRGLLKGYVAIPVFRWPREKAGENPVAYLGRRSQISNAIEALTASLGNWSGRRHRWDVPMGEVLQTRPVGMESQRWPHSLRFRNEIA